MITANRILVIKRDALGDVISVTPFLEVLRRNFPAAHITYLVGSWSQAVLKNNPSIDELVVVDSKTWQNPIKKFLARAKLGKRLQSQNFDTVFILQGPAPFRFWENFALALGAVNRLGFKKHGASSSLTGLIELPVYTDHLFKVLRRNRAEYYLDLLIRAGVRDTTNDGNKLYATAEDRHFAENFWTKNNLAGKKVITIAPGGAVNPGMKQLAKRWPADCYAQAIDRLTDQPSVRIVFVGGPSDKSLIEEITRKLTPIKQRQILNTAGLTNIHQTAELIARSALFIGNDSGTIHIASTTKTPIIGLYGPTNPVVDGPYKARGINLFHKTSFSPCYTMDCSGHKPCIENITVEEVITTAQKILEP